MAQTYSKTPVLSKIKFGNNTYYLKDADVRTILDGFNNEICGGSIGLVTETGVFVKSNDIKSYVDAQIGTINKFDVKVVASLPETPSAATMYILYLVPETGKVSGTYVEYITIRNGAGTEEKPYTYAWEKIGTTATDLTNYLKNTATVAGVAFGDGQAISAADLETALGLGDLAYKDSAAGTVEGETITGVKATGSVSGTAAITATPTEISSTASYTPVGTITVNALNQTDTAATLTKGDFTPEGTVAVTLSDNAASKLKTAGTAPTFQEGTFTPNTPTVIDTTKFNGGSLGAATTGTFATEGVTAAIDAQDNECLVFGTAGTSAAVTAQGSFTAASLGAGFYTAGSAASKAADTFNGGAMPTFDAVTVGVQAATFTGTTAEDVLVTGVNYDKATANGATFAGTAATITATGSYDKVDDTATVTATGVSLDVGNIVVSSKDVTVS